MLSSQPKVDGCCLAVTALRQVIPSREIIRVGSNRDTLIDVDLGFPEFIDGLLWTEDLSDHLPPFLSF